MSPKKEKKKNSPVKLLLSVATYLVILLYIIYVVTTIVPRYVEDMSSEKFWGLILIGLTTSLIVLVMVVLESSRRFNTPEKNEMSHIDNQYAIIREYKESQSTNTPVEVVSGRCQKCGAKVTRDYSNCPKCGSVIR